ncbi:MAG TPA: maleylpyruvate isomerase family mycothiol-dependent enzyme [Acidimicrobiia bacterium]|nr:maleylpyruvate isomerase family mycothiol-dependent enzyme [Acidimicrobiia bacterium]
MTATATHVSDIPGLSRTEAMTIAAEEFGRWLHLLRELTPDQWAAPTECEPWDVRTMVCHVLGATESHASLREMAHQMRAYRRAKDGSMIDAMTALQIRDRASLSPDEIVPRFEGAAPRSVRARRRMPGLVRRMPIKVDPPFDKDGWRLGYLMDVIYNRDAWMHRVDVSRATGRDMVSTAAHDGRLVADVIGEWASRHGKPFTLVLTGPAGGTFVAGEGGECIELDAVEFCRVLSGRAQGVGLMSTEVPF